MFYSQAVKQPSPTHRWDPRNADGIRRLYPKSTVIIWAHWFKYISIPPSTRQLAPCCTPHSVAATSAQRPGWRRHACRLFRLIEECSTPARQGFVLVASSACRCRATYNNLAGFLGWTQPTLRFLLVDQPPWVLLSSQMRINFLHGNSPNHLHRYIQHTRISLAPGRMSARPKVSVLFLVASFWKPSSVHAKSNIFGRASASPR